jgi:hypothetical protein
VSPARRWRNWQARRRLKLSASLLGKRRRPASQHQFPLAIAEGLFAEQALDVGMAYFNSAAEMNEVLASGSMHITATGDVPTIGLMAHKGPAKCLAPLTDFSYDQGMVVRKGITETDRASSRSMVWMRKDRTHSHYCGGSRRGQWLTEKAS